MSKQHYVSNSAGKKASIGAHYLSVPMLLCLLLIAPSVSQAQRLYDEERDKKAQEAAKLAEEINNNAAFINQLKNLDTLSKRDVDLYFKGAKRQMELDINAFRTWGAVSQFVQGIKTSLLQDDFISNDDVKKINDDLDKVVKECNEHTTDLGKNKCKAEEELKKLKQALKDSEAKGKALEEELKTRLEKIDVIESLVNKANSFLNQVQPGTRRSKDSRISSLICPNPMLITQISYQRFATNPQTNLS